MPKAMYGFQRYFRVICLTTLVVSVVLVAVFQYKPFEHSNYYQSDSPDSLHSAQFSPQPNCLASSLVSSPPPQDLSASNSTLGVSQKIR
jgi:hypothetical protein